MEYGERNIVEDIGSHYRLEGDDFWYVRVFGGHDRSIRRIGSGPNPDPRRIGPRPVNKEKRKVIISKGLSDLVNSLKEGHPK